MSALLGRPASATEAYRSLADDGGLISQGDPRLYGRGLIVPGGGLCGTTCGTNILHAIMRYAGYDTRLMAQQPDVVIHALVNHARHFGIDARMGITPYSLAAGLEAIGRELNVSLYTEYREVSAEDLGLLQPRANELLIGVVDMAGAMQSLTQLHAIVFLGADEYRRLMVSDPNWPSPVQHVGLQIVPEGYRRALHIVGLNRGNYHGGKILGVLRIGIERALGQRQRAS